MITTDTGTAAAEEITSNHDATSTNWAGKTVSSVRTSTDANGRHTTLTIVFTDGTEILFGGISGNVVWITLHDANMETGAEKVA
jgi:hypothetical protein